MQQLCQLMDQEYEINMKKLRKQREEQKKAQIAKLMASKEKEAAKQQSRSAQLAQGYTFKNPHLNKYNI